MKSMVIVAGLALVLAAPSAIAGPTKSAKHKAMSAGAYTPPERPIPYTMLESYMKASPKQRQAMLANASSMTAQTDASTNAAATTSSDTAAAPAMSGDTPPASGMSSGGLNMDSSSPGAAAPGPVNPTPSTPPTDAGQSSTSSSGSAAAPKP